MAPQAIWLAMSLREASTLTSISLGPWAQRPLFKTNIKTFVSLRKVPAPIPLGDLQRLCEFFPTPGYEFRLDPSFEPELTVAPAGAAPPDPANTARFAVLQRFNRVNLVVPVDAPSMWHAAIQSVALANSRCLANTVADSSNRI